MTAVRNSTRFQAQDVVRFGDGSLGVVIGNFGYPIDGAEFVEVAREHGINFYRVNSLVRISTLAELVHLHQRDSSHRRNVANRLAHGFPS